LIIFNLFINFKVHFFLLDAASDFLGDAGGYGSAGCFAAATGAGGYCTYLPLFVGLVDAWFTAAGFAGA
jgi:hypothetical protein